MLVNAAGVSPSQASIETILKVGLYGTAVLLEEVGKVIACGGTGVTISSQSGHRMEALGAEIDRQLACTPTEELLQLDVLQPKNIRDTLHAYQMAKRCNVKRVMAEAVKWGERGASLSLLWQSTSLMAHVATFTKICLLSVQQVGPARLTRWQM